MKVSELTGVKLDYWVARALGDRQVRIVGAEEHERVEARFMDMFPFDRFSPSRAWYEAGPIIEREAIHLERDVDGYSEPDEPWYAGCGVFWDIGSTPLIAAMRAFVKAKVGDHVVPDETPDFFPAPREVPA